MPAGQEMTRALPHRRAYTRRPSAAAAGPRPPTTGQLAAKLATLIANQRDHPRFGYNSIIMFI